MNWGYKETWRAGSEQTAVQPLRKEKKERKNKRLDRQIESRWQKEECQAPVWLQDMSWERKNSIYVSWLNHKVTGKKKMRRTGEIKESIGQITAVFTSSYTSYSLSFYSSTHSCSKLKKARSFHIVIIADYCSVWWRGHSKKPGQVFSSLQDKQKIYPHWNVLKQTLWGSQPTWLWEGNRAHRG